jgi:hypothetical protein
MGGGAAARRCLYSDLAGSAAAGPTRVPPCVVVTVRAAASAQLRAAWRCDGCCVRLHVMVHGRRGSDNIGAAGE